MIMSSISGWYFPCFTDFLKDKIADLFCHIVLACAQASILGTYSGAFLESILKHGRKANHLLTSRVYAVLECRFISDMLG